MKPGRSTHAPEIREATIGGEHRRALPGMGDPNVETVRRHYFNNFKHDEDDQVIDRWGLPQEASAQRRSAHATGCDLTN